MAATADQDRLFFARDVTRILVKALRTRRLYDDPKHPYVAAACEELHRSLRSFLAAHGTFRVDVTKETLLLDQQPLYEEKSNEGNVATRLFQAGLRELAVHEGVEPPETNSLLSVLGMRFDDTDLGTLLETASFTHVEFLCLDELAEGWDRPDGLSREATDRIIAMNEKAAQVIQLLGERLAAGAEAFEVSDSGAELDKVARIAESTKKKDDDDDDEEEDFLAVSTSSVERFRESARSTGQDVLTLSLIEIILDGLALEPDSLGDARACWFLAEAPRTAVSRGDLLLLEKILERYEKELAGTPAPEVVGALQSAWNELATPAGLEKLANLAAGGAAGGPPAYCQILRLMGIAGVKGALATYARTKSPELKDALERFLADRITNHHALFLALVEPEVNPEVARWALFITSKALKGPPAEAMLEAGMRHRDAGVRSYADFTYRTQTPRGRIKGFLDALASPSSDERIRAARQLAQEKDQQGLAQLRGLVDDPGFLNRSAEEKRAFLEAIADIAGRGAISFLRTQTTRKTGIFKAKAATELKTTAEELIKKLSGGAP